MIKKNQLLSRKECEKKVYEGFGVQMSRAESGRIFWNYIECGGDVHKVKSMSEAKKVVKELVNNFLQYEEA